ncbi:MAG: CvpA family protein [Candidatus Omnitrophica bacterium]|nr:CvpA family protein [Candidatus Omnitrophota bacterium]
MIINMLKQFNWVDILVVVLFLRILSMGLKTGFLHELFKTLGTVAAIYVSLHYFSQLTDACFKAVPGAKEALPVEFLDFVSFLVLAIAGYCSFVILRIALNRFLKVEAVDTLNRWGGLAVSVVRALLVSALVIFGLAISTIGYLKGSAQNSYLGARLFPVAPSTYSVIWNSLAYRFAVSEKFNAAVSEIESGFIKQ